MSEVKQPAYDFEFAKLCKWLKENGLVMFTDINGRSVFYKKAKQLTDLSLKTVELVSKRLCAEQWTESFQKTEWCKRQVEKEWPEFIDLALDVIGIILPQSADKDRIRRHFLLEFKGDK